MIQAKQLRKSFGTKMAVREVSFVAQDGVVTGLLGPNGAGKTTTLRMLSGLVRPDNGTVVVDGRDGLSPPLTNIAVLPERSGLYDRLTARENIRYFGALHGLTGLNLERRIDECVAMLGLQSVADRRVAGFSTGERMQVALARVLVHHARNLLLDEPTNGLDVMSTRGLREVIRRLRDEGVCVIFSSHVMAEVGTMCDQLVVIALGRVIATGSPRELITMAGAMSLEDAFVSLSQQIGAKDSP